MRRRTLETIFLFISLVFAVLVACSGENKTAGGVTEDEGIVAIVDKAVDGVSQKGPYVKGSQVNLYELDGNLKPTGKVFPGEIFNDRGEFSLTRINLESQFVHLVSKGYYRNEISGKTSVGEITLNAISNILDRKTVNINLLTHLEYPRVLSLISNGMSLSEAKSQAESEVFSSFYIDDGEQRNFEDLNIFKNSDEDAALLAVSVLLQRELSEGDLTAELKEISDEIAEKGAWSDKSAKAKVADWAASADLEPIRANIEKWNFGTVPQFEHYVKRFWWFVYGLGDCNEERDGDTALVANKQSVNYEKGYVCRSGNWTKRSVVKRGEGFDAWNYTDGNRIASNLGEGQWAVNTDAFNGGTTTVAFGKKEIWNYDVPDYVFVRNDPILDCEGLCGTIHFGHEASPGSSVYAVFSANAGGPGNAASWLGFCVEYESSMDFFANVQLEDSFGSSIDYDNPGYYLLKSSKRTVVNVPWDSLYQLGYSGVNVNVFDVMDIVTGLKMSFTGSENTTATFNIVKVGALGTCE